MHLNLILKGLNEKILSFNQMIPKTMKLSILMFFVSLNFVFAENSYAQKTKISVKMENQPIEKILDKVEKQSDFTFLYDASTIDVLQRTTIDVKNSKICDILDDLLSDTDIAYKVVGNKIILKNKSQLLQSSISQIDKVEIKGVIVDDKGQVVIGASIIEKGTANGTTADIDGQFTIRVSKDAILEVSSIGYETQDIPLNGRAFFTITLHQSAEFLNDVVVVGFGTQKKENLTGAVSAIDDKVFASRPVSSAIEMLQGTVPGLNITQTGGASFNSTQSLNVRGITTIGSGSSGNPLILIDGMEGDLNSLNPQDIKNISVLKDATSSSIYGSRAPFGVILVTTKSGSKGKTVVNYNNSFRMASPIDLPNLQNSWQYGNMLRDADNNNGRAASVISDEEIRMIYERNFNGASTFTKDDGTIVNLTPSLAVGDVWGDYIGYGIDNTDWYNLCFDKNVFSHEHNLSVKGGTDKINYYASLNYSQQNGLYAFNKESLNRITSMIKLSAQINKWTKIKWTNRFTYKKYEEPSNASTYDSYWKRYALWVNGPAYDANGYEFGGGPAFFLQNSGIDDTKSYWNYQQLQLQLEPIKDWKTFVDFNYKHKSDETQLIQKPAYNYAVDGVTKVVFSQLDDTYMSEDRASNNYINVNAYTQYSKSINDNHNFKIMGGFQCEKQKYGDLYSLRNGLIIDDAEALDLTSGQDYYGNEASSIMEGNYQDWSTCGFFGRLNYDYKGKYLFEFNYRYDGSSRFRSDNRWGSFPSASVGWNMAREDFFENLTDYIDIFKLRASYGELGNQNTTSYYPTYEQIQFIAAGGSWLLNNSKPNVASEPTMIDKNLTWETIKNWNFGLDLSAFDDRLTGSFDYYIRETDDMVGPAPDLPSVFGYTVPKQNNTDLRTNGFELMISWRDVLDNNLSYGVTATLSDSKTKILSYPNDTKSLSSYYSGMQMGEIWGYETIGIAKSQEEMDAHLAQTSQDRIGNNWSEGDIMYKDLNGDNSVDNGSYTKDDHGDLKVIGNDIPRYRIGVTVNAAWRGFDIRAFFQGVLKRDYFFSATSSNGYSASSFWGVCQSVWNSECFLSSLDYYRPEGSNLDGDGNINQYELEPNTNAYFARPLYKNYKNEQNQTRYLQDASYIRLKNIQLGYTLPNKLTQKWGISNIRVFISGENVATWDNLPQQYDPETLDLNHGGIAYPLSKTWSCGVNVTF